MVFVRSLACLKRLGLVECVTKTAVIRPILALTPRRVCSDEAKLSHEEVVALFIQQGVLHTPHVIAACKAIDPALFANDFWELEEVEELEQEGDEIEYVDEISEKQERSEVGVQAMVAYMIALELLSPRVVPGAKVLDIASGSGLIAAHFSHMVGPNGLVVAVDSSHAACRFARGRLAQLPFTRSNLRVFENNAYFGFPDAAPFDAIHVDIPKEWIEQLKEGGVLCVPVKVGDRQVLRRIEKVPQGVKVKDVMEVAYDELKQPDTSLDGRKIHYQANGKKNHDSFSCWLGRPQ